MRLKVIMSAALTALVSGGLFMQAAVAAEADFECGPEAGVITTDNLDEGTDVVECDLVGEALKSPDTGLALEIPEPGVTVEAEALLPDAAAETFSVAIGVDGVISFEESAPSDTDPDSDAPDEGETGDRLARDTYGCDNREYAAQDTRRRATWQFYMGDGSNPAGLTDAQFREILGLSARTWRDSTNPCGAPDITDFDYSYQGTTTRETDMQVSGGVSRCADRDGYSVIDASNLDRNRKPPLAINCTWSTHDSSQGPGYTGPNQDRERHQVQHRGLRLHHEPYVVWLQREARRAVRHHPRDGPLVWARQHRHQCQSLPDHERQHPTVQAIRT